MGISKRQYLNAELGPGTVRLMKTIKRTLDPLGLFNPGKARIRCRGSIPSFADITPQLYPDD